MPIIPIQFITKGMAKVKAAFGGVATSAKALMKSLGPLYAAYTGLTAVANGLKASLNIAGETKAVESAFNNLGKKVDGFSNKTLGNLSKAVKGTVSNLELMQQANNAMILGVVKSEEDMTDLVSVAKKLANAVGKDASYGVESLVTGMGRQSKLMLDNLGILIDTDQAYLDFAEANNTTVKAMTEVEKKQAFNNATLKEAKRIADELGPTQDTLTDSFNRVKASASNLGAVIGKILTPVVKFATEGFVLFVDALTSFYTTVTGFFGKLDFSKLFNFGNLVQIWKTTFWLILDIIKVVFTNLPEVALNAFLALKDKAVEVFTSIGNSIFGIVKTIFSKVMSAGRMIWDPIWIGMQIVSKTVQLSWEKLMIRLQNSFNSFLNKFKEGYNTIAEIAGMETFDITPNIDIDKATNETKDELDALYENLKDTDIAKLFTEIVTPDPEAVATNYEELGGLLEGLLTKYAEDINIFKEETGQTDEDNPSPIPTVSEEQVEEQLGFFQRHKKAMADMSEENKKSFKEGAKSFRENLAMAAKEYKAFQVLDKAMKIKDILRATPAAVSDAYNAGMKTGGPMAPVFATAFAATALAAKVAQLSQLKSAAVGYSGQVTSPTMFLAGEGGPENIEITPLNAPNVRAGQAGGGGQAINIAFEGNVMSEDFIVDSAIPMIRDAIRRGETLVD